mmetsp:Transcript_23493/g.50942  ORF Transcript_23493/g.50942 Transcript_23493/m.50942 type:complete len:136 (+) Transcript_23493:44-451(+)
MVSGSVTAVLVTARIVQVVSPVRQSKNVENEPLGRKPHSVPSASGLATGRGKRAPSIRKSGRDWIIVYNVSNPQSFDTLQIIRGTKEEEMFVIQWKAGGCVLKTVQKVLSHFLPFCTISPRGKSPDELRFLAASG